MTKSTLNTYTQDLGTLLSLWEGIKHFCKVCKLKLTNSCICGHGTSESEHLDSYLKISDFMDVQYLFVVKTDHIFKLSLNSLFFSDQESKIQIYSLYNDVKQRCIAFENVESKKVTDCHDPDFSSNVTVRYLWFEIKCLNNYIPFGILCNHTRCHVNMALNSYRSMIH